MRVKPDVGLLKFISRFIYAKQGGESHPWLLGLLLRFWGFAFAGHIFVIHFVADALGASDEAAVTWVAAYVLYDLFLEVIRALFKPTYEGVAIRVFRIVVNVVMITWLVNISTEARLYIWSLYFIPIIATIAYFPYPSVMVVVVFASSAGLIVADLILPGTSQLTPSQVGTIVLFLGAGSVGIYSLLDSLLSSWRDIVGIGSMLYETPDLEALAQNISDIVASQSVADHVLVIFIDPHRGSYVAHASDGLLLVDGKSVAESLEGGSGPDNSQPSEPPIWFEALEQGKLYEALFGIRPETIVVEPMFDRKGNLMGVVSASFESRKRVGKQALEIFRHLCQQASQALELSTRLRLSRETLSHTIEAGMRLDKAIYEQDIFDALVERSVEGAFPGACCSTVYAPNLETGELNLIARFPLSKEHDHDAVSKAACRQVASRALDMGQPIVARNVEKTRWLQTGNTPPEVKSIIAAPLTNPDSGLPFALLSIHSQQPNAFDGADEVTIAFLAYHAVGALVNVREGSVPEWRLGGGMLKETFDVVRQIDFNEGPEKVSQQAAAAVQRVLGFQSVRILLTNEDASELVTTATSDMIPDEARERMMQQSISWDVLEPLWADEFKAERSFFVPWESEVLETVHQHFFCPRSDNKNLNSSAFEWEMGNLLIAPLTPLTPLVDSSETWAGLMVIYLPVFRHLPSRDHVEALCEFAGTLMWALDRVEGRLHLQEQKRRMDAFIGSISYELARTHDLDAVGEVVVQVGAKLISAEACSMYLVRGQHVELTHSTYLAGTRFIGETKTVSTKSGSGLTAWVAATGETLRFNNNEYVRHRAWSADLTHLKYLPSGETQHLLIVPIIKDTGDIVGVLSLENKMGPNRSRGFDDEDEDRLEHLAYHVLFALESIELHKNSLKREREGFEEDLHDILGLFDGQVNMQLEALGKHVERGNSEVVASKLPEIVKGARTAYQSMKSLHTMVSIAEWETKSFKDALQLVLTPWIERPLSLETTPIITLACSDDLVLPPAIESAFLRIAQNAVANSQRHSGVIEDPDGEVVVRVERANGTARLEVRDNGKGVEQIKAGFGLRLMRKYIRRLNRQPDVSAEIDFDSAPGEGFSVTVVVKLAAENLRQALQDVVERWEQRLHPLDKMLTITLDCPEDIMLPPAVESTFLRIAQNAIANAERYAGLHETPDGEVVVRVAQANGTARLEVRDNGLGAETVDEGPGLSRMRRHIQHLRNKDGVTAKISFDSALGEGFSVTVEVELSKSTVK